jgi:hypothetical protein
MRTILGLATLLLLAPLARGATLSSTVAFVGAGTGAECNFTNVSSKTLGISASIIDDSGNLVTSIPSLNYPPGVSGGVGTTVGLGSFVRCVVSYSGSTKAVRGALLINDGTSGAPQAALPAN